MLVVCLTPSRIGGSNKHHVESEKQECLWRCGERARSRERVKREGGREIVEPVVNASMSKT